MTQWFSQFLAVRREGAGALEAHLGTFADALAGQGHTVATAKEKLRLVSDFGRWLDEMGSPLVQLDEGGVAEYLAHQRRRRKRPSCAATLSLLLEVLRRAGLLAAARQQDAPLELGSAAYVLAAYRRHLHEERGLHRSTQQIYVSIAGRLLASRFRHEMVRLQHLHPSDVTQFLCEQTKAYPLSVKVIAPALRSFLRWLYQCADTPTNLADCIPAVASRQLAIVPMSLPTAQVKSLLAHCDRATTTGRRDYAILLLLGRLGLRAGEVVAMQLDDIDWENAALTIRGKCREDRLPLPHDVGAAVAAYLRRGRPKCSTRRIFIRARAPYRPFASSVGISNIVERAMKRAGLKPPRKGAHTLRHALACEMLREGASLVEIGQILRHRSPNTTAIYAKVDFVSLRLLAQPWPRETRAL